jgi:hypothetical protein
LNDSIARLKSAHVTLRMFHYPVNAFFAFRARNNYAQHEDLGFMR